MGNPSSSGYGGKGPFGEGFPTSLDPQNAWATGQNVQNMNNMYADLGMGGSTPQQTDQASIIQQAYGNQAIRNPEIAQGNSAGIGALASLFGGGSGGGGGGGGGGFGPGSSSVG